MDFSLDIGQARSQSHSINKPRETDGFWDLYLIRPLGGLFVQPFKQMGVSPTTVSVFSSVAGVIAAYFYYWVGVSETPLVFATWGFIFFLLSSAFDSADGQLARLTGKTTLSGRLTDGVCDNIVFVAIYLAIFLSYNARLGEISWVYFFLALTAGYSHSTQSALTDFQRQVYRFFVYDHREILKEEPETLKASFQTGSSFFKRFFFALHLDYARRQRFFCASTHRLLKKIVAHPHFLKKKMVVAALFQKYQIPRLKWWALLGPNSHKIVVILLAFLPITAGSVVGMVWFYFYNLVVLNLLMFCLILWQKNLNQKIFKEVQKVLET